MKGYKLTMKDKAGTWKIKGFKLECLTEGHQLTKQECSTLYGVAYKLKQYEESDLDPEDCEQIKNRVLRKELIERKALIEKMEKIIEDAKIEFIAEGEVYEDDPFKLGVLSGINTILKMIEKKEI